MREFDHNGLLMAEYQGKLFELSAGLNCSSPVFIRRFLHSDLLKNIDNNSYISFDVNEGIRDIINQYKDTDYGKEKYAPGALFWMGYMYRYIAYTRNESTDFVMKLFKHKQMNTLYYTYHTQDPEWCIKNLLDLNGLDKDYLDKNKRLKTIMKTSAY